MPVTASAYPNPQGDWRYPLFLDDGTKKASPVPPSVPDDSGRVPANGETSTDTIDADRRQSNRKSGDDADNLAARRELIRELLVALESPSFVFARGEPAGRREVIMSLEHNGESHLVALDIDRSRNQINVTDVVSVHSMRISSIVRWIREGKTVWHDPEKSEAWLTRSAPTNPGQVRSMLRNTDSPPKPGPEGDLASGESATHIIEPDQSETNRESGDQTKNLPVRRAGGNSLS